MAGLFTIVDALRDGEGVGLANVWIGSLLGLCLGMEKQ